MRGHEHHHGDDNNVRVRRTIEGNTELMHKVNSGAVIDLCTVLELHSDEKGCYSGLRTLGLRASGSVMLEAQAVQRAELKPTCDEQVLVVVLHSCEYTEHHFDFPNIYVFPNFGVSECQVSCRHT